MKAVNVFAEITTLFLILFVGAWWLPTNWQPCQMFSDSHFAMQSFALAFEFIPFLQ